MGSLYCTVEDVRRALGSKSTASDTTRILDAIRAGSADVDDVVNRVDGVFRPITATRYFEWPDPQTTVAWQLWLDANSLISVSSLVAGGTTIPGTDYLLEPQQYGPPYDRIEVNRGTSSAFSLDDTPQRAIAVTGLWGYADDRESAGTLVGGINASVTSLVVSDGSLVGIGDHLIIDSERLEITGRSWSTSAQTIQGNLAASAAGNSVAVTDGTQYHTGELVLIDAERCEITDIAGNTLVVKRAVDGSTLAAHTTGATVYVQRTLTVTRGAQGSTAATHSNGATISRHVVPADVKELALASAVTTYLQGQAGYAKEYGPQGASTRLGIGLPELRDRVAGNHGRSHRTRAI